MVIDHGVRQCILAPRRQHSSKPDETYEALERLFGPVRRLELIARTHRPGWEAWGNEMTPLEAEALSSRGVTESDENGKP
jgi:N6-adenosine-specific RNA methylase IME4